YGPPSHALNGCIDPHSIGANSRSQLVLITTAEWSLREKLASQPQDVNSCERWHRLCSLNKRHILTEQEGMPLQKWLSEARVCKRQPMSTLHQAQLHFALARLRWRLDQPLACGGCDWGLQMARALEQFRQAFDQRVAFLESPKGPLVQIADPELLPLTTEAQQ